MEIIFKKFKIFMKNIDKVGLLANKKSCMFVSKK